MREAFKLKEDELFIPELHAWLGALGAAMFESDETRKRSFKRIHQLQQHTAQADIRVQRATQHGASRSAA